LLGLSLDRERPRTLREQPLNESAVNCPPLTQSGRSVGRLRVSPKAKFFGVLAGVQPS